MRIPSNWSFDVAGVAEGFDRHVREQLPWYDLVTRGVVHMARHYVPEGGVVWDVGASTGNITRAISAAIPERRARYFSVESSEAMAAQWRGSGELLRADACDVEWEKRDRIDFAVFFLVLMFVPVGRRRHLLQRVVSRLRPGGAAIVVDKTVALAGYPATVMWRLALAEKLAAGAAPGEIVEKELSLSGAQRPLDPVALPSDAIEWFRFGDFAGWLVERGEG